MEGTYKLLELKVRANKKEPPKIKVVDMANEIRTGNYSLFSNELKKLIADRMNKKEQVILLMNRRGFSSFVMCRECGEVVKCPHCEVSLTYHKIGDKLKCHYCGYEKNNVSQCPSCRSKKIRFVGGGTQKVVEEINKLYPEAKVLRMDMDNTKNKGGHEKIIDSFLKEEADILVGTQMVAKGLDFPKVSLVGILNCDLALKYPSYNSPSVAYNLFVQVSGRAGRHDTDGVVVMQSYDTTHYALFNASSGTYKKFYEEELQYRKLGNYPPFKKMIEITVVGKEYEKTFEEANDICKYIKEKSKVLVLGPAEDYIVKINDLYNFKITIKYDSDKMINDVMSTVFVKYENNKDYKIYISRK
jgi:primosomal protein N' (replication factor Y)